MKLVIALPSPANSPLITSFVSFASLWLLPSPAKRFVVSPYYHGYKNSNDCNPEKRRPPRAPESDCRDPLYVMSSSPRILYCHCAYAQVVPKEVKAAVLKKLCESGVAFEAVADLCELSARRDPSLKRLAEASSIKIAACYPRAVKWLFSAAQAPLPAESTEVLNMRVQSAADIFQSLSSQTLTPNLPAKDTNDPNSVPASDV
jgi:hypothetical protein